MAKPKAAGSDNLLAFGAAICGRRTALGLTQMQVALGANLSWKHVGKIERGQVNSTLEVVIAISRALHTTAGELLVCAGL